MRIVVVAALLAVVALLPGEPARAAEPYLVFVTDANVAKDTGATAGAITPSLCTALDKRPGLTVMCAPDVRQMLEAAGQLAAFGQQSPAVAKLEERLEKAQFVVVPYLTKTDKGIKLLLRLYHKGDSAGGVVVPGRPAGRIVEIGKQGDLSSLLEQLDAAAARAEKMLYEPRNNPGNAVNEPPAPIGQ